MGMQRNVPGGARMIETPLVETPRCAEGRRAWSTDDVVRTCIGSLKRTCIGSLKRTCIGSLKRTCFGSLKRTCIMEWRWMWRCAGGFCE